MAYNDDLIDILIDARTKWQSGVYINILNQGDSIQVRLASGSTQTIYGPVSNSEVNSYGYDDSHPYLNAHLDEAQRRMEAPAIAPPTEAPDFYTFEIEFWTPLPSSMAGPIMNRLVQAEDLLGWEFWQLNIDGTKMTVGATKKGSVTLLLLIGAIVAVTLAIVGLFIVRSYTARVEAQLIVQKQLSEEREAIEVTKQQIVNSDLPPDEKIRIIDDLEAFKQQLPVTPQPTPDPISSPIGEIKDLMYIAVIGGLAVSMVRR